VVLRLPEDSGPHDNAVNFVVRPKPRALKVLQLGTVSEPLTRALRAATEIELFAADTLPADVGAFDLVVVNGIEIARHPETNVLWLGAARAAGESGGQPREGAQPTQWESDHPLSRSILWSGITIGAVDGFPHLQGAETIIEAGDVPLLEARTTLTGREVRLAFDIGRSNWPAEPGFPVFVSNLLHWIAPDLGRIIEPPCIVGASCVLDPRLLGAEVVPVALGPDSANAAVAAGRPASVLRAVPSGAGFLPPGYEAQFIPDRAGIYRLRRDTLMRFVAANASRSEAVPPPANTVPAAAASVTDRPSLRWWLLVALLSLLLAEAWLAGRGSERFLRRTALARSNPLAARRRFLLAARLAALSFTVLAVADAPFPMLDRSRNIAVVTASKLGAGDGEPDLTDQIYAAAARDKASGGDARLGIVTIDANGYIATDLGDR